MKPLPQTPELLAVAERVVWFKPPAEALADPVHFLAHVMTYGTAENLRALDGIAGPNEFCEALDNASLLFRGEAGLISEHAGNCVSHELSGVIAIDRGQLPVLRFNAGREMYLDAFQGARAKRSAARFVPPFDWRCAPHPLRFQVTGKPARGRSGVVIEARPLVTRTWTARRWPIRWRAG